MCAQHFFFIFICSDMHVFFLPFNTYTDIHWREIMTSLWLSFESINEIYNARKKKSETIYIVIHQKSFKKKKRRKRREGKSLSSLMKFWYYWYLLAHFWNFSILLCLYYVVMISNRTQVQMKNILRNVKVCWEVYQRIRIEWSENLIAIQKT